MPSAKNSKNSTAHVHHPPTNRAFALRMMNSAHNTESRMSPLDRALKPFKESFKKSNKSKRAKDKSPQSPTASFHSTDVSRSEETPDTSFDLLWTNQFTKRTPRENSNGVTEGYSYECSRHLVTNLDDQTNGKLYGTHRAMTDIAEEEENSSYGQIGKYWFGLQDHSNSEGYSDSLNSSGVAEIDFHSKRLGESKQLDKQYPYVENRLNFSEQEADYFVAPNGEAVRLRKKRKDDGNEDIMKNGSSVLRTERFGKRLSLLCHMLAEKYPEDFHILELLVELQVSNEKREEEMNRSVSMLKRKLESVEYRLARVEQQSLSSFQQMLMPLAVAAEKFSKGMKDSLSNFNQYKDIHRNGSTITENQNDSTITQEEHPVSLNATFAEESEAIDTGIGHNSNFHACKKGSCESNCELEYSEGKLEDSETLDSQIDASALKISDRSIDDKKDISIIELDESIGADGIEEFKADGSPNLPSEKISANEGLFNKDENKNESELNLAIFEEKYEQNKDIYDTKVTKNDELEDNKADHAQENTRGSIVLLASETSV